MRRALLLAAPMPAFAPDEAQGDAMTAPLMPRQKGLPAGMLSNAAIGRKAGGRSVKTTKGRGPAQTRTIPRSGSMPPIPRPA